MRKEIDIVIDEDGRDKGKRFHIREMSAFAAEEWAIRALLSLGGSNANLDFEPGAGMAALASAGIRAFLTMRFDDAKPLLDEMLACVSVKPDPANPGISRPLLPDDIEEVATIFRLRREVLNLHVDFSLPGARSKPI